MLRIIMNPPYDGNFHLKVLSQMLNKFPDADIVNLSPIRWLQDPIADLRKNSDWHRFSDVRNKITVKKIIKAHDAGKMFNCGFWHDLGISKNEGSIDKPLTQLGPNIMGLYKKLLADRSLTLSGNYGKNNHYKHFIHIPRVHGHKGQKDEWDLLSPDPKFYLDVKDHEEKELYFKTKEEAINCFNSLHLRFYKGLKRLGLYIYPYLGNVKWTGKSGVIDGYKNPITDDMLFEYFNLTDEEIKEICSR